ILAVLAAVVVLNVTKYIGAGCTQAAATELHNIETAVAAYMYDNPGSTPPTSETGLGAYFLGTPHGNYTIVSSGTVTQAHYTPCIP
ncbi:MAG: general secretion pathway protein, partial [Chloroflexi bacterium]|nr:general secretion pathway protein [Chloroflexota bacterium]